MPDAAEPPAAARVHLPVGWRLLAAVLLGLVCFGLLWGGAAPVAVGLFKPPWDKLAHLSVFAVIGMAFAMCTDARGWPMVLWAVAAAVTLGAIDELLQLALPGRDAGWDDLVADALGGLLGLLQTDPTVYLQAGAGLDDAAIQAQIQARADAKKAKNFAEADRIRNDLLAQGVVLKDSAAGTTWEAAQ